jgi:hypothetical protein
MRCIGHPQEARLRSRKPLRAAALAALAALTLLSTSACDLLTPQPNVIVPDGPPPGPEARCTDACVAKAHACSAAQCARGCRFVLDKLVEREGPRILACVARADPGKPAACDDMTFAECAARTGPYADGGPAPPRPPTDDDL